MLYLNINSRERSTFDTVAPFYGKELTDVAQFAAYGVALQTIEDKIRAFKEKVIERTVNYFENEVDMETLWQEVTAIVDERNGRIVPQNAGDFLVLTPSEPATEVVMKRRLGRPSKKKA